MKEKRKKRIVSGIKPTGRPHLGNYFGMMQPALAMQETYEVFLFVADYHALNSVHTKEELQKYTRELILDYLAIGLDPEKTVFYLQSALPELAELTWIFSNLITIPWLERAHAYKDALAKEKELNVGLFGYPVLMAADILATKADFVPVGKDQIQHIEMTREIMRKFHARYGKVFKEPQELVQEVYDSIPGIDGRKMSKSYGNTIPLFGEEKEVRKKIMRIVTDSLRPEDKKDPEKCNIFQLHKLITPEKELQVLEERYREGGIGYAESKELLFRNYLNFTQKMREKRAYYEQHPNEVDAIMQRGNTQAREEILPLINEVKEKVGFLAFV